MNGYVDEVHIPSSEYNHTSTELFTERAAEEEEEEPCSTESGILQIQCAT